MARTDELKANGWYKKAGLWINPLTKHGFSLEGAANKLARDNGFKDYKHFEKFSKTQNALRFKRFASKVHRPTALGSKFVKLLKDADKKKFKPGSEELDRLLKYVNKRNNRSRWVAGETPKKR